MSNLPQCEYVYVAAPNAAVVAEANTMASAEQLVLDLSNPDLRENALLELSKVSISNFFVSFMMLFFFPI